MTCCNENGFSAKSILSSAGVASAVMNGQCGMGTRAQCAKMRHRCAQGCSTLEAANQIAEESKKSKPLPSPPPKITSLAQKKVKKKEKKAEQMCAFVRACSQCIAAAATQRMQTRSITVDEARERILLLRNQAYCVGAVCCGLVVGESYYFWRDIFLPHFSLHTFPFFLYLCRLLSYFTEH